MRFVIQRVTEATCEVDQKITGQITNGFCVLIGIAETDTKNIADKMIRKLLGMRIFGDENGKTNLSLHDIEGSKFIIEGCEWKSVINITVYIICGLPEGKPSIFYQSRKSGTCKQSLRIYYCKMQRRNSGCTNRNLWCRYENFSDKRRAFYHIAGF